MTHQPLQLLPADDLALRLAQVHDAMASAGLDALLVGDNANLFYLTGRVFCGYVWLPAAGEPVYFLRRPSVLSGEAVVAIRKPEDIAGHISVAGLTVGLMGDDTPWGTISRLQAMLAPATTVNASAVMRRARAVKTPREQALLRESGMRQTEVYARIPRLFRPGMTDLEFQIEIERELRLHGCLGQFRVSGAELEIFMGNVLTGDNADTPSPYDFAMGGAGMHPSLPAGADGSLIRPGHPVMVDMNGNFTGYMTDMTRCFVSGQAPAEVAEANDLSAAICRAIAAEARPGVPCRDLYALALDMARQGRMEDRFMGHRQHAGFVGHGIGITINEGPVLAPRSRDVLQAGNAIALEPKFVLPGLGAVGIENSYIVQPDGPASQITCAPEQIESLAE